MWWRSSLHNDNKMKGRDECPYLRFTTDLQALRPTEGMVTVKRMCISATGCCFFGYAQVILELGSKECVWLEPLVILDVAPFESVFSSHFRQPKHLKWMWVSCVPQRSPAYKWNCATAEYALVYIYSDLGQIQIRGFYINNWWALWKCRSK